MPTNRYSRIFTGLLVVVVAFVSVAMVARPAKIAKNLPGAASSVSDTYLPLPPGKQAQLYAARDARHIYHGRSGRESLALAAGFPDYFQRHPELTVPAILGLDASDYFQRHPELSKPAILGYDASDYFQRHPELSAKTDSSVDLSDYYFRHLYS